MTAILLLGYNRPENIIKRVGEISRNNPSHLYISLDKCEDRSVSDSMKDAFERAVRNYHDPSRITFTQQVENLGISNHIRVAIDKTLETEKQIVILEDDISIGSKFLSHLEVGYKSTVKGPNVGTIGGFSGVPILIDPIRNYWRKSKYFSAWGWMVGVDTWSKYQPLIPPGEIETQLKDSNSWQSLSNVQRKTWVGRFEKVRRYPKLTWDYQMQYTTFKYDLVHTLPLFRICENEGFADSRSTNTRNPRPKWMQSEIICEAKFSHLDLPWPSQLVLDQVDSFTISGDSGLRKGINKVRGLNS